MNSLKLFAASLLSLAMVTTAAAQESKEAQTRSYPYFFAGIQGGAQTTFTNYDATKLITPIGGVNVGAMLAPAVGARLHVSGINNKGGFRYSGQKYDTTTPSPTSTSCSISAASLPRARKRLWTSTSSAVPASA
ncbi:MAG: hypothetical protein PUC38_07985 [Bacteroidales bacterium]|nr:hypothetical protein [Bacteroidales bacterium]